ncbi:hypothetical protein QQP08_008952 [Theobroma cacao]|uniref:Uncharacterized protein n=1 Tax=Theobroma cacao TaxID=3641 RepID=A0A061E890_THECC|nr:Uncharacterized protein TCM_007248 [Theobroma cacao]WRX16465.1 hypothetical protein QQP08_008952 [Theobroma cacao]
MIGGPIAGPQRGSVKLHHRVLVGVAPPRTPIVRCTCATRQISHRDFDPAGRCLPSAPWLRSPATPCPRHSLSPTSWKFKHLYSPSFHK